MNPRHRLIPIPPVSRTGRADRSATRFALVLLAALALGACSGLLDDGRAAPTTWWLEPADLSSGAALPALSLEMTVVPGLDSDRILTLDDDAQLNHFEGALWPERLPDWVHSLVARSLETAPQTGAQSPGACRLELELRRFWARVDAEMKARSAEVAMNGTLRCGSADPVSVAAAASEPVAEHRLAAIVSAFQRAFDNSQRQLAEQLEQQAGS